MIVWPPYSDARSTKSIVPVKNKNTRGHPDIWNMLEIFREKNKNYQVLYILH